MINKEILHIVEGLSQILQDSTSFPANVSYAIIRNFKILSPIAEDIYNERENIIKKYGEKIEDGHYQIPEDKINIANQELDNLLNMDTNVQLVTFSIDNLLGYDIPLKTMNILYFIIEDSEK